MKASQASFLNQLALLWHAINYSGPVTGKCLRSQSRGRHISVNHFKQSPHSFLDRSAVMAHFLWRGTGRVSTLERISIQSADFSVSCHPLESGPHIWEWSQSIPIVERYCTLLGTLFIMETYLSWPVPYNSSRNNALLYHWLQQCGY